jgi:hypothetical protein
VAGSVAPPLLRLGAGVSIPSLSEFAAEQGGDGMPIEAWLKERGIYHEITTWLTSGKPIIVAYRYLKKHYQYPWASDKPLFKLKAKLIEARDREIRIQRAESDGK